MAAPYTTLRHFLHLLRLIVLLQIILLPSKVFAGSAAGWLMKINAATTEVSFSGTFVYIHDEKVEAIKIARRVTQEGTVQEHLRSLNGPQREVIRDANNIWYSVPNLRAVTHDRRQSGLRGLPKIIADDLQQLKHYYHFVEGADMRIANRPAHQINVVPNDAYRYGYSLWADSATGLLLRSDLINQQNEIVEQYLFIDIEIGKEITDEQLASVVDKDRLHLSESEMPVVPVPESSGCRLTQIPDGYMLSKHIYKTSPTDGRNIEHLVYTDGLSSFSVFITETEERQDEVYGLSRMGAVHVYHTHLCNYKITIMGEVPAKTVEYLAQGLQHPNPECMQAL